MTVEEESVAVGEKSRKEKRKERKKMKRKLIRKDISEKERLEEEKRLNDPVELKRVEELEKQEMERMERDRREFQERERLWFQALQDKRKQEEEEIKLLQSQQQEQEASTSKIQVEKKNENTEDDEWEYVEEGPPEIIWQGNEIIVRKKKVRVPKKGMDQQNRVEDADRPTSNPLPPQSEAFAEYQNAALVSAQQVLENVAQQVPNFGTEQDKAHCPFHLKTGACRFGERCSRVHFYPDKACTLLIRNMYNGPGLVWEQDEGLEHTDEEVEGCYEEFYEDVHTEFLKYGEIINFKACKNSSPHLRGNVYVHYKSIDSAVLAFHSNNGRYFAGKQVKCEFVNVSRWKVAICGEYMKSRLKTCSRGITCNFIHCFRNPGGDYEWADWDKPPPRFWVKKMAALFGYSDESACNKEMTEPDRHHARRSRSRDIHKSSRSSDSEDDVQDDKSPRHCRSNERKQSEIHDEKTHEGQRKIHRYHSKRRRYDHSGRRWSGSDGDSDAEEYRHRGYARTRSRQHYTHWEDKLRHHSEASSPNKFGDDMTRSVNACASEERSCEHGNEHRSHRRSRKRSGSESIVSELLDNHLDKNRTFDADSCDYQLESSNSRYYSHAGKRLQNSETDLSVNGGANDEKPHGREHAAAKSYPKRERTDRLSRTRVHLSRSDESNFPSDVMQPNEIHVDQYISKHRSQSPDQNSLQRIDAQDRWQPESPDTF